MRITLSFSTRFTTLVDRNQIHKFVLILQYFVSFYTFALSISRSAFLSNSILTTQVLPVWQARWRGVFPLTLSCLLIPAPIVINRRVGSYLKIKQMWIIKCHWGNHPYVWVFISKSGNILSHNSLYQRILKPNKTAFLGLFPPLCKKNLSIFESLIVKHNELMIYI